MDNLPANLLNRMRQDSAKNEYFRKVEQFNFIEPNSNYKEYMWSVLTFGKICVLVSSGSVGILCEGEKIYFLDEGYHSFSSFGTIFLGERKINIVDNAIVCGSSGFVTISQDHIGVMLVKSEYKILPPGSYQWNNPYVSFKTSIQINEQNIKIGPYQLISVVDGTVAITYKNGKLNILGENDSERIFFLDNPNWIVHGYLDLGTQISKLEDNDLLSKDNVEIVVTAIAEWKIVNSKKAIIECGRSMKEITEKVTQLFCATISRIVANINIDCLSTETNTQDINNGISQQTTTSILSLMQSTVAKKYMTELSTNMNQIGIKVIEIYAPEKHMKNDDVRHHVY
ncbi:hypothetical protein BMW23_0152 [Bodo saltans virus]|uniref:Band 7 domain-containing protein n=1 Tax=Bodo saltans virus TaxID=2024608 RepID=A0A2H4UTE5_9VIRU|nr:hypothetical protein QJ851_gp0148 [Bodo saltans virus]ATZ80211.1 hypothetical protein BMW23_0152 [Bodo saltans virus]